MQNRIIDSTGREYQLIIKPPPETIIWRYMDFAKFMSLIQYQALFFPYGKFMEDKYDGSVGAVFKFAGTIDETYFSPRSNCLISCWHINEDESAAMWAQYSNRNAGIAIRSTVDRLERSMNFGEFNNVIMGEVNYGRTIRLKEGEAFSQESLFFDKRKSFAHEQEFRVLIAPPHNPSHIEHMRQNGGLSIQADLTTLIDAIFIAPFTEPWFEPLTRTIINDQYKLDIPILRSQIDSNPAIG